MNDVTAGITYYALVVPIDIGMMDTMCGYMAAICVIYMSTDVFNVGMVDEICIINLITTPMVNFEGQVCCYLFLAPSL